MTIGFLKRIIAVLVCCSTFSCLYAQKYHVHMTERTILFTADNVSIYNISNCVGGVFIARESNQNISYLIDTLCNTLGAIYLDTSFSSFYPNFYEGEVLMYFVQSEF